MEHLRHWGKELAVVVVGVLLALWAQAWFESRQEGNVHRATVAQIDLLFRRTLVQTAARVSSNRCAVERIAELDDALRASTGQWRAMPLRNLPQEGTLRRYAPVYLVDADVLPLQIFDTARSNGTLASLPPAERQFYEQLERQLHWLDSVWNSAGDPSPRLSVLSVDGPLSDVARDGLRQDLAWLERENQVTILRAQSLARLARERGVVLTDDDLAAYRGKIDRDRGMFGNCVVEVDPLTLAPVQQTAPSS